MIISRTPYRVSFFGGGTDYPQWFHEHGGAVLATSINKFCYITCRWLPPFFEHKHRIVYSLIENVQHVDEIQHPAVREILKWANVDQDGLEIHHDGDLPARSGLGSSSSFTVGLVHALEALRGRMVNKATLAGHAIHIEQDLVGETVGSQDQISASFGGFNKIDFNRNGSFNVNPVIVHRDRLAEFQGHLMLCFTGFSRIASEIAGTQVSNFKHREAELQCMRQMVDEGVSILQNPDQSLDDFGKLLHKSWQYKRMLSNRVSTRHIDEIYKSALEAGAIGGKILGAGGGGFMLLFARPERHAAIRDCLNKLIHVPFKFENSGSSIVLYQPHGL